MGQYTQQCGAEWKDAGVGDVKYFTCKISTPTSVFFAGFKSESGAINGFKTIGNLGADGRGKASGNTIDQSPHGALWGYYKQVYGTNDPSINQVVLVPDSEWVNTFPANTNDGGHNVEGGTPTKMLLYVMWAGYRSDRRPRGFEYSAESFTDVMRSMLM